MTMTRFAVFMTDEVTGSTSAVNWKAAHSHRVSTRTHTFSVTHVSTPAHLFFFHLSSATSATCDVCACMYARARASELESELMTLSELQSSRERASDTQRAAEQ